MWVNLVIKEELQDLELDIELQEIVYKEMMEIASQW